MIPKSKNTRLFKKRYCYICLHKIKEVDYKNEALLKRFISSYAKIVPKRRSGSCSKHQRQLARAIKRARVMGILPYTIK